MEIFMTYANYATHKLHFVLIPLQKIYHKRNGILCLETTLWGKNGSRETIKIIFFLRVLSHFFTTEQLLLHHTFYINIITLLNSNFIGYNIYVYFGFSVIANF